MGSFPVVNGSREMKHIKENDNLEKIPRPTKSVAERFLGFSTRDPSMVRGQNKDTKYSWLAKDDDDQDENINFSRLSEDDVEDPEDMKNFSRLSEEDVEDREDMKNFSRLSEDDDEDRENMKNFSRLSDRNDEDHGAKINFSRRMQIDDEDKKTNFSKLNKYEDEGDQDEKINFSRLTEDDDEDQDEKINFTRLTEDEEDSKNREDFSFEDSFEQGSSSFKKLSEDSMPENESLDSLKDYSDEDSDALLEACIQSGMPSVSSQPLVSSCHGSQEIKAKEEIQNYVVSFSNCETSDSEDEDLQNCIQLGLPQDPRKSKDSNNQLKSSNSSLQNIPQEMDVAEASDEDDYAVLQHIIDFGKPKSDPKLHCTNSSKAPNHYSSCHQSQNVSRKIDALEALDEEEYNTVQQHVKLNKPNIGPKATYSNNINATNSFSSTFKNQNGTKDLTVADVSDEEGDSVLLQNIIDFGKPKIGPNMSSHSNTSAPTSYSAGHRRLPTPQEMDVLEASDEEDYSPMLQTIIEFGKPKLVSHSNTNASHSYLKFKNQGYREKQPDGSSDDDQDILAQCILNGMPKPRQPYSLPTRSSSSKPQPPRQPQPRDYKAAYASSHTEQPHAFRKSPTTDYRTLYTKANQQRKSPTKVTNSPLRNSSSTKDKRTPPPQTYSKQRQQHKRCPTPEERAILLSSFAARRSLGIVPLPNNRVQYRTCTEHTFYNPTNQMRKVEGYQGHANQIRKTEGYQGHTNQIRNTESCQFPTNQIKKTESYQSPTNQIGRSESYQSPTHQIGRTESYHSKYHRWINDFRDPKIDPAPTPDVTCTYRTEDTPILSPSASISDLSTLSFPEDRMFFDRSRNNSRNSDSSSDDELLRQCIRAGMPSEKRALG